MVSLKHIKTLKILYTKIFRNAFSRRKGYQYQKFVIVGLPRSGTTLLHTYLNYHPNIWSHGETIFNTLKNPVRDQNFFPPFSGNIKAVGIKSLLPLDESSIPKSSEKKSIGPGHPYKFIFIHRENLLRWYVSLKVAQKSKQWSQTYQDKIVPVKLKKLEINVPELLQSLDKAKEKIECLKKVFYGSRTFVLTYEDLNEIPETKLKEIQVFLGVKPKTLFSLLQKQNSELLSDLITNYDEVHAALNETPYQKFLEKEKVKTRKT